MHVAHDKNPPLVDIARSTHNICNMDKVQYNNLEKIMPNTYALNITKVGSNRLNEVGIFLKKKRMQNIVRVG